MVAALENLSSLKLDPNEEKRKELLEEEQDILVAEYPTQVLYDTPYLYFTPLELKGIKGNLVSDPSERFAEMEEWYIKTKRVLK